MLNRGGAGAALLKTRDATPADVEALLEVQRAASLAALGHIFPSERYPFPDDAVRARWRDFVEDEEARVLLAERDAVPLGVAASAPWWLHGLYVVPSEWGSGLGAQLHDDAVAILRSLGCGHAHLWVLEENVRARRFYERRGWRPNDETRVVPYPPQPLDVGYSLAL